MEQTQILQLRDIALARAGAMWPNESVEEYLERVTSLAAQLHVGFTDREDTKSLFTTKLDALLAPRVEALVLKGVLIDIIPRADGKKWDFLFLPIEGDYAMKFVKPSESSLSPRPTYVKPEAGMVPFEEVWHTDEWNGETAWIDSPAGEAARAAAAPLLGKGVAYECHREPRVRKVNGQEVPYGHRVFDRFVEEIELTPEMAAFTKRILAVKERARAAAEEYAA